VLAAVQDRLSNLAGDIDVQQHGGTCGERRDARWQMRRRSRMAATFTSSWLWVRSPSIAAPTVVLDRSSVGSRGLPDGPRCNVNPRPCTTEWPEKLCRDRAQSTFCDASRREEQFGTQPSERAARAGALVTLYGRPVSYE
jgi:hypothetical protein